MKGFNIRDFIGLVLIGAFIGAMGAMFQIAIPKENKDLLTYMLGQLSGFVAAVVALHYVTKAGEKELDAKRTENTGKALDAISAAQAAPTSNEGGGGTSGDAASAAGEVADAAVDKAAEFKDEAPPAKPVPGKAAKP